MLAQKTPRRSLNTQETKNKLLNTAMLLFTRYGYDKVTVEDITKYAGVSKGTFYNYFHAKDEVLVEQFNKIDGHYEQLARKMTPQMSASERILSFVGAMCEYCEKIWGLNLLKVVYINQISLQKHPTILLNKQRLFYRLMTDIVREGQERGEFSKKYTAEAITDFFARAARSTLYEWCLHNGSIDLHTQGRESFELVLHYIRA